MHVFKSAYDKRFQRDPAVRGLRTQFWPHVRHPVLRSRRSQSWRISARRRRALGEQSGARGRGRRPLQTWRVARRHPRLSVGTGTSKAFYPRNETRWFRRRLRACQGWGFATRWQTTRLSRFESSTSSRRPLTTRCAFYSGRATRVQERTQTHLRIRQPRATDVTAKRDDWISRADHLFTHHATRIADFLHLNGQQP